MPMLPDNNLGRWVFVSVVQSSLPAVSGNMERNWHKLIVISVRFVIMRPALSLHMSKSLCRVRPLHSAITWYNKSSDWIKAAGAHTSVNGKRAVQRCCFEHGFQLEAVEWTQRCALLMYAPQRIKYYLRSVFLDVMERDSRDSFFCIALIHFSRAGVLL